MFTEVFHNISIENRRQIENTYSEEISIIMNTYNTQMELLKLYLLALDSDPYVEPNEFSSMIFTAIYKNYISLYSALDLTLQGFYGSARLLFRNVYEFLIISKTVAIRKDMDLLEKWKSGDDISLRKEVFRKVKKPQSLEMQNLWKTLCEFTHGTIYSQQVRLEYSEIRNEVKFNFVCMEMLIDMNYHVLNSYAANSSIQYYTKFMSDLHETDVLKNKKKEIRTQISSIRKTLLKEPKRVVLDFTSKWEFK